jgi:rod shape-determining protein MreC
VQNFLSLPDQNDMLTAQIAKLEQELQKRDAIIASLGPDSLMLQPFDDQELKFRYHPTHVVSMTTNRRRNHVVLDKGAEDGITEGMGVITPDKNLVGYIIDCSERYSVAMPVLNTEFTMGGSLQMTNYTCSVRWSGESPYHVDIIDVSTYAQPEIGMAVEAWSERLPKGVIVGHIESFEHNAAKTAFTARLKLAVDMSALNNVLIVENTHYGEIESLMDNLDNQ